MVSDDRGQMILIAAVLVAISILGSVVLLNVLHVPADINTRQDARSLDTVERATIQVSEDLERLFLVHTSVNETSERVPYAQEVGGPDSAFETAVENYSAVNGDLSASASSTVVRVEYLDTSAGSQEGTFIRHNDTSRNLTVDDGDWDALSGAESVPYLYLNVTGANESGGGVADGQAFQVSIDGETVTFDQGEVELPGGERITGSHGDLYPVEMEIVGGAGEIRNGSLRRTFTVDPGSDFDVTFRDGNKTTGEYAISGTDVDSTGLDSGTEPYQYKRENVIVNPKFRLNVTDASVTHSTTFALYNGTGS